jgi:hypothetical protein
MDRSIGMLLHQMKQLNEDNELRAPDRCEGVLNYTWQQWQHLTTTETEQDKITMFWKVQTVQDVQNYLHITVGVSEYLFFLAGQTTRPDIFFELCYKVNEEKTRSCLISEWEKNNGKLMGDFNKDLIYSINNRATLCKKFIESCDVRQKEELFGLKHMFFVLELVSDTEPDEFYQICHVVNMERTKKMKNKYKHRWNVSYKFNNFRQLNQESLQQFVLDSTSDEIQKIFDQMIVKRKWRTYMFSRMEAQDGSCRRRQEFIFWSYRGDDQHKTLSCEGGDGLMCRSVSDSRGCVCKQTLRA